MVILAVLATVIVALALSYRMADVGLDAQRLMDMAAARENNYQVARSAVELGFELLRQDTGDTDSFSDYWAMGTVNLELEGRPVSIQVVDEESKFPLVSMQADPDSSEKLAEMLTRFMEKGAVENADEAVDQFLDWVDIDMSRRPRGAERREYPSGRVKDAPMDSIDELLALPAWAERPSYPSPRRALDAATSSMLSYSAAAGAGAADSGGSAQSQPASDLEAASDGLKYGLEVPESQTLGGRETSEWTEWMSLYSNGKINLNTAPKELLLCLDEEMSDVIVDEIDSKRRSSAFTSVDELREVTGMNADLIYRIQDYLCVKSEVFQVQASVNSYPGKVCLSVVVSRGKGGLEVKRWEIR